MTIQKMKKRLRLLSDKKKKDTLTTKEWVEYISLSEDLADYLDSPH